jgi:hypothetical protein
VQFYVSPSGNDGTGDGSSGNPWASPQGAINYCNANIDFGGQTAVVNCAGGVYNTNFVQSQPNVGGGQLVIQGTVGNMAAVTFNCVSGGNVVQAANGGALFVQWLTFAGGGGGSCYLQALQGGTIGYGNINFTSPAGGNGFDLYMLPQGTGLATGDFTITGPRLSHIMGDGGFANETGHTITLAGGVVWTYGYAFTQNGCYARLLQNTFVGTATGPRFSAQSNSIIQSNGSGPNYLPGSTPGTTDGYGAYF